MSGVIMLTSDQMHGIANKGQSLVEDHLATYTRIASHAEELATQHMKGQAGPAVLRKAQELHQKTAQFAQTAGEKFQGIGQFATRTDDAEAHKSSRIDALMAA
ncbi:hypothetical protein [Mycobacteroides abscessus]|uniref:hypothetical protein n=1 Tax=Mycobacteroides abscessus TaxID=36809 RepID=UPI0009436A94|nr:hypothetical protein [Mycobacteroides abscessus]